MIIDFILNIDKHLASIVSAYGSLTYLILFLIIFCEVGLVITPFLPGDSLLFVAGAISSITSLNIVLLFIICACAAIIGNIINYYIGIYFSSLALRHINPLYLEKTNKFYEKYGGFTIIASRFMPIIRTFAPFIAGVGKMNPFKFISYSIIGGILWTGLFLFVGYFFGNIPIIKDNFSIVVIIIIILSLLPALIEYLRIKLSRH
jgi:membrane-associated protein